MKTKLFITCAIAFVLFTSFEAAPLKSSLLKTVTRNTVTDFSFFRTHRQGKNGITATWGVTVSTGVTSFYVQRTYEDPADPYAIWETWTSMPFTGEKSYKATDTGVFPGFITYRVIAVLSNGTELMSALSTVHIVSH